MNKKSIMLKITAVLLILTAAAAGAQDLYFGGYARNTTGVFIDSLDFSEVKNTFDFKAEYFGDTSAINAEVYLNQTGKNDIDAGIKELYMDIFFDSMDIRIGKQQIIWGKADGAFITDVVSPKNLSSFILPDFDEIRMGVTGIKTDIFMGPVDLELVWLPEFTPAVLPSGDWTVSTPLSINQINLPVSTLENSEVFGKLSYIGSFLDIELMGGYMWDDLPSASFDSSIPGIAADYNRVIMTGGSFSTDIAGLIIKGEGAFYRGRNFTILSGTPPGGVGSLEKDFVNYMVGLDYSIAGINFGTQFIQEIILDYDSRILLKDEYKNTMTFVIARKFFNDTLKLEFFSYVGLDNSDALLRPKVTYNLADGLEMVLGSDIFLGDSGDFGQYNDKDLVYTKLKYSF